MRTVVITTGRTPHHDLLSFLASIPCLELLPAGDDTNVSIWAIRDLAPELIILAIGNPDTRLGALVHEVRTRAPGAHCLALVPLSSQLVEAVSAGADRALLNGFSAVDFFRVIQDLGATPPHGPHIHGGNQ